MLAGDDDQGRFVEEGTDDVSHTVAGACCGVQDCDGGVSGSLGESVCHTDDGGFLQGEDVAEVGGEVFEHWLFCWESELLVSHINDDFDLPVEPGLPKMVVML